MKKLKFLGLMGVIMAVAVAALIGVAGSNLSRTVGDLEVAVTKTQSDTVIARVSDEAVLDPDGSGYVAPLGENKVTESNKTSKVLAAAVGAQGMVLGMLSVCLVVIISLVVRYWLRARNSEE